MLATRREFLRSLSVAAVAGSTIRRATAADQPETRSPNERPRMGAIGLRYQGSVITEKALPYGDLIAVCDVDQHVREQARAAFGSTAKVIEDYRALLDLKDIDVILIGTPDHWHSKMVIDACRAGKDVYVEKPLTLTVDEGKVLTKVVAETGRVVQVGSWQRSDVRFRHACEMVRSGRLGTLRKVTVVIDPNPTGGPFENVPAPKHLNWNLWLGQAPLVPYCEERSHYTFRWWFEYAGGKITDWGAHHVDVAQWGIGMDPIAVDGKAKLPSGANGYNTPPWYEATVRYPNNVVMEVRCHGTIGVRFEGDRGSIFVTRGSIESDPQELLKEESLTRDQYQLYSHDLGFSPKVGKLESIENHMRNFFDCVKSRNAPISDVVSQHKSAAVCHLLNISMRLGRPIEWDSTKEEIVGDRDANAMLAREQRKGFEVV